MEYEEFIRAAIDKSIFLTESSLKFAFKYFDKENKGEITADDLCSIFSGDDISKSEIEKVRKIVKSISQNEKINFSDFSQIMRSFLG